MKTLTQDDVNAECYQAAYDAGHQQGCPEEFIETLYEVAIANLSGNEHDIRDMVDLWVAVRQGKKNIVPRSLP